MRHKQKAKKVKVVMRGAALREFRESRHWSREALGDLLGLSGSAIFNYEAERRSGDGTPVVIPKLVRLALAALAGGVLDYDGLTALGPPGFVEVEPLAEPGIDPEPPDFEETAAQRRRREKAQAPRFRDVEA